MLSGLGVSVISSHVQQPAAAAAVAEAAGSGRCHHAVLCGDIAHTIASDVCPGCKRAGCC